MIQWTDTQTELRNSVVEWSGRLNDTAETQSDKENLLKMWQVVREMGVRRMIRSTGVHTLKPRSFSASWTGRVDALPMRRMHQDRKSVV